MIETVKGFKDYIGEEAQQREDIRNILVNTFEQYGFEPAETPVVEYEEFVRGENTSDEAVSDIYKLVDKGERKLALRYEFTFQLKRLMQGKKLPFKRFCIGPVFRDEPTTGNRFRQFVQCDIDTVSSTVKEEAELLSIVKMVLKKLGIEPIIYVNNRKLLNEILEKANIEKSNWEKAIKEIDKLDKLDKKEIYKNLKEFGAEKILEIFERPESFFEKYDNFKEIEELEKYCKLYDVKVKFSPSLARGLSYYNGSVFEVKTKEMKETITGGGSYMFNNVQCSGLSFGLDRLSKIAKTNLKKQKIMIISIDEDKKAIELAQEIRELGIICLLSSAKISKALEYANSQKIEKVIFIGKDEVKEKKVKIRNMQTGKEKMIKISDLKKEVKNE